MKRFSLAGWYGLLAIVWGSLQLVAGTVDVGRFPVFKEVAPGAAGSSELAKFLIDAEVQAVAEPDYRNLRLATSDGREQPWLVRQRTLNRRQVRDISYGARIIEIQELADNRLSLVLKVETVAVPPFSGLRLQTGLRNFEKEIRVWASPDGAQWTPVAESAVIYDYSRFADVRRDRVPLTPNPGPWFRVEMSAGLAADEQPLLETTRQARPGELPLETERRSFQRIPFRVEQAELIETRDDVWALTPFVTVAAVPRFAVSNNVAERETIIDFAGGRRPVIAVDFQFEEINFVRPVRILGRNRGGSDWRFIAEFTVHSIGIGSIRDSRLRLDLPAENRWDEYRVVIRNHDNPPLTPVGLSWRENCYEMLFLPQGLQYRLYYGGEGLELPVYDIGQVLARADPELGREWIAGPAVSNPGFRRTSARSKWPRHVKTLLVGAMVLAVAALLVALGIASRRLAAVPSE